VLVLSDVIGDPLETIASGPCMPVAADPRRALAILDRFGALAAGVAPRLARSIAERAAAAGAAAVAATPEGMEGTWTTPAGCRVSHLLLGTNATAVAAAARAAAALGYAVEPADAALAAAGSAEEVGRALARAAAALSRHVSADGVPRAVVAGGEATVRVPADHGRGGRNQQTVLAALAAAAEAGGWPPGCVIASIGTDGEDGPTDAAGGVADADVAAAIARDPAGLREALLRCDAHPLLDACGGLVRTGPTGTNVADVRIVLAAP
jgi:glycerate-2-kinase